MQKKTRKEKEIDLRKEIILEAAWNVFKEKGFIKTTMQDIAEKSEYALGTIYKLFPSKEDIFTGFLSTKFDEMLDDLESLDDPGKNPTERLHDYIRSIFEFFSRNEKMIVVANMERWSTDNELVRGLHTRLQKHFERLISYFADLIKLGVDEGFFRPVNPMTAQLALKGMIMELFWHRKIFEDSPDQEFLENEILRLFLYGISSGERKDKKSET